MSIGVESVPRVAEARGRDPSIPDVVPHALASAPWGTVPPDILTRALITLCRTTPLGRGRARAKVNAYLQRRNPAGVDCRLYGQPVRAYFGDNRCEWKAVLNPALFDPVERAQIAQALDRPKAVMLDIGANVGIHALAAAATARPDARIIAFEPHPETYRRLAFNLSQNSFRGFTALQVALGAAESVLHLAKVDLSLSSLINGGEGPAVRVRPLLACLSELGITHVDVLKIDVEGYESEVLAPFLAGAPDDLVPRLVVIEALGTQHWAHDCIELLRRRGLEVAVRVGNNAIMKKTAPRAGT